MCVCLQALQEVNVCNFIPFDTVNLMCNDIERSSRWLWDISSDQLSHSPVRILVKSFCGREAQHAADDTAAAQVPATAAGVTPLPRMLHFQHSFRDQTAAASGEHGPQASLLQANGALSVRNHTSFRVEPNKRSCFCARVGMDLAAHLNSDPRLPSAFVMHSKTGFTCLNKHETLFSFISADSTQPREMCCEEEIQTPRSLIILIMCFISEEGNALMRGHVCQDDYKMGEKV